ncbi:MAG: helix-turn-helix domain-containing protein [Magnetospirillum sp.]|nr:helix-turn-helix domain-containing protein [Magnetospirillum sp.]
MSTEALAVLARAPLFTMVPRCDLPTILDDPMVLDIAEGELWFAQGAPARRLFLILDGTVELTLTRDYCPPELLARLGAGETVGAEALVAGGRHAAAASAAVPTAVVAISSERLLAYLDRRFDTALAMIAAMAGSLRGQIKEITELKLQSTTERLASYLCELAGTDCGRAAVRLPCEKRLLADRLGMEPATLSRAFAKLRDAGVESGRGDRVVIADVAALRRLGDAAEMVA